MNTRKFKCSRLFLTVSVFLFLTGILNAQEIFPGNNDFEAYIPLVEGKRVALFTNQSGTLEPFKTDFTDEALPERPKGKHILDELLERGINIALVFSPEHGFRGNHEAGEKVSDYIDESTGTKIISLYGVNVQDAIKRNVNQFDVVLVDIQDVGLRYYTYYITMMRIMQACAKLNKPVIILDRPNPNGFYIDGPILQDKFKSGVGALNIPVVHGLTLGEMALMINGEKWIDGTCDIKVIQCKNYSHSMKFALTSRPSPNLKSMRAIYLYASTCYFENTLISVGRGTDYPFEVLSDNHGYVLDLRDAELKPEINLSYIIDAYNSLGSKNFFGKPDSNGRYWIDKLFGTDSVRRQIEAGSTEREIKSTWQKGLRNYRTLRKKYLLYPD